MSQKQIKKVPDKKNEEVEPKPVGQEKTRKLKEGIDRLVDEVDDILEKNSEEFIKSYVQRSGE